MDAIIRSMLFFLLLHLFSCQVHQSSTVNNPPIAIDEQFYNAEDTGKRYRKSRWWEEFGSNDLNGVVEEVLRNNLDLRQSFWQAVIKCQVARQAAAAKWPQISVAPGFLRLYSSGGSFAGLLSSGGAGQTSSSSLKIDDYLFTNSLSYEVDLWKRVDSLSRAACLEAEATERDLEAATLLLSGTAVDLWFTIQEQKALLDLINHQIEVSRTQKELIELRFGVGLSTALDVYQQRLQLEGIMARKPQVESLLRTSQNQLNLLMAKSPNDTDFVVDGGLPELPAPPYLGRPIDLLSTRPELKAELLRIKAKDYEVAAAVADMFPRLDLSLFYDFQASDIKDIFQQKICLIISQLTMPIIDGGRRRAVVKQKRAEICRLIAEYGQKFLTAIGEIEDALVREKQQLALLSRIESEIDIARSNLEESRWHYVNGLNDYLTVIAAIQSLQDLERSLVAEKKNLLVMRSKLLRALGLT